MIRRVVTFDLATNTGWANYAGGQLLGSGTTKLGKVGEAWKRMAAARDWLPQVLRQVAWGLGEVAYEAPLMSPRNFNATRSAIQLEAALLQACQSLGIPERMVHVYHVGTIKKAATGSGRASKDEVVEAMSQRWGLSGLSDDNEADALAVLHLHLSKGPPKT